MQNYCKTIGALAAASALAAGNASAEIEYEIHTGLSTQYIFRGIDLGDDLAEVGVDVATEFMGFDVSAGAWYASWEAPVPVGPAPPGFSADVDELDIYAEVSKDLGFATFAVGYIYYHFPQAIGNAFFVPIQDAQEVYFSVSKEIFGLDTSLAYFWDIETDNDGYMEANVSKSFELSPCLVLNAGGTLGYLAEEGDLTHLQAKVSLDWAFTETATLSPYIAHSWSLSEGGRFAGAPNGSSTALYTGAQNEFFGGAMLSVSF